MTKKQKPTTRFKIWVEIERIETDAEGNETYVSEDNPVGIAYRDTIEEAVRLQEILEMHFGELPEPAPLTKEVILCATCNSDNVLIKTLKKGLCIDCTGEHNIYKTTLKGDAKVIGFQVMTADDDMNIHPDMAGSFCVYSLKQARAMIAKGCQNKTQKWTLLTVWTGDIEEPTMMFKGDPRK